MDAKIYEAILDSVGTAIVFTGNDHIIRYANRAAGIRYGKRGYPDLIGKSLFECHSPASQEQIRQLHARLMAGEDEIFLKINSEKEKITIVGVRDAGGQLIGYYERFEKTG
ncbi:MAG: PAS domain-containing protein [Desulfococcaceae bacterium]